MNAQRLFFDRIHSSDLRDGLAQIGVFDKGVLTYVLDDLMVKHGFEKVNQVRINGKNKSGYKRVNCRVCDDGGHIPPWRRLGHIPLWQCVECKWALGEVEHGWC